MNQRQRVRIIRKLIKLASVIKEDDMFFIFENGEYEYADPELGDLENISCNKMIKTQDLLDYLLDNKHITKEQYENWHNERPYGIFSEFFDFGNLDFADFLTKYPINDYSFEDYEAQGFAGYILKKNNAITVIGLDSELQFQLYNITDNHVRNISEFVQNKWGNIPIEKLRAEKCVIYDLKNKSVFHTNMADLLLFHSVGDLSRTINIFNIEPKKHHNKHLLS